MKWLKPDDVADRLTVSRTTIIRMCVDGEIPAVKARGQWRVREDYEKHLESPFREAKAA